MKYYEFKEFFASNLILFDNDDLILGKDEITGERRIGFRLGTYASGSLSVGPIDDIPTLPEIVIKSAKVR